MGKKERFAFYLTPEKKAILERRYQEDGSRSMTAFVERAVDFYLDYLSANDAGLFLPTSIKSYLDGRLGQLEERLSSLAFRQAVEQDMVAGILADAYQFSDEDLRRRRAESVQNVKKTNGHISLEQRVRGAWEQTGGKQHEKNIIRGGHDVPELRAAREERAGGRLRRGGGQRQSGGQDGGGDRGGVRDGRGAEGRRGGRGLHCDGGRP